MKRVLILLLGIWIASWTTEQGRPKPCSDGATETVDIVKDRKRTKIKRKKVCYDKNPKIYTRRFASKEDATNFFKTECPKSVCKNGSIRKGH